MAPPRPFWDRAPAAWAASPRHSATWDWAALVDAGLPVNPRYRTRPCRNWQAHGRCRYGPRCQFAHGARPGPAHEARG